jgi:hypothetical protein
MYKYIYTYIYIYIYIGFDDAPPVDHIQEMHNFVETIVFDTTGERHFYTYINIYSYIHV